jgi:membrane-associated HD superfamily phosphohydrolase
VISILNTNMSIDIYLETGIIGLSVHILLYFFFLRKKVRTEVNILGYHILLSLFLAVITILFLKSQYASYSAIILTVSIYGIYSLSFLELWTLSQISYSREILVKAKNGIISENNDYFVQLQNLGDQKRVARLNSLKSKRIIFIKNNTWHLTKLGQFIANILNIILWLPNIKNRG